MSLSSVADILNAVLAFVGHKLATIFLSPASFSLATLLSALAVATLFLAFARERRSKQIKLKVLLRAIFPRRLLRSASSRADVGFFLFNSFLATTLFGWAILSYHLVSTTADGALVGAFGARPPTALSEGYCAGILTVALFLAYELGYWLDHYLSHKVPILWEFHKVHHSAEVLSPLTNFRVHPLDTLVFYNILALVMGGTGGLVNYWLGRATPYFTIANSNVLTLVFFFLIGHLQHSHFWIAFTGVWGRVFLSPAHHQIHHSANPIHFDKNLGSCLGIWDWLFGTLYVPGKTREKLSFGVEPKSPVAHTVRGGLIAPLCDAFSHIRPLLRPRRAAAATPARSAVSADWTSVHSLER
jgi:sterol desaturase/sphingolipid hydroxylase (fatty acid hydroxylase superfamily)